MIQRLSFIFLASLVGGVSSLKNVVNDTWPELCDADTDFTEVDYNDFNCTNFCDGFNSTKGEQVVGAYKTVSADDASMAEAHMICLCSSRASIGSVIETEADYACRLPFEKFEFPEQPKVETCDSNMECRDYCSGLFDGLSNYSTAVSSADGCNCTWGPTVNYPACTSAATTDKQPSLAWMSVLATATMAAMTSMMM